MSDERDIVALVPVAEQRKREVTDDVVTTLRELLDRAEQGEIQGIVIAFVHNDGDIACRWTEHHGTANMLAAVTMAQHRYANHVIDTAVELTPEHPR